METEFYLILIAIIAGGIILGVALGLLIRKGYRKRRVENSLHYLALTKTLPPEHSSDYTYSTRGGIHLMLILLGCVIIIPLFSMTASMHGVFLKDLLYIAGLLAIIGIFPLTALILLIAHRDKKIVFSDSTLKIEGCAIRSDTGQKGLSVEIPWGDIKEVDFADKTPHLTTIDGLRYEIDTLPFIYGPFRMIRGYDRIEIWTRMDYYHKLYGTGLSDEMREQLVVDAGKKRTDTETIIILAVLIVIIVLDVLL